MKILILGGRQFLGRHVVDSFLKAGHEVTLFNRAQTNSHLFSHIPNIIGDRYQDLSKIEGQWDVVIDPSGYDPKNLAKVAAALSAKVSHYIFISSVSVYDSNNSVKNRDEKTPIVNTEIDSSSWQPMGKDYGACKFLSERAVDQHFNGTVTHLRPGLIVGPFDSTARFPYWINRIMRGGDILSPPAESIIQFVDARDIADWVVEIAEKKIAGIFNVSGRTQTLGDFLNKAQKLIGSPVHFKFVTEKFLKANDVGCWIELPLWVYQEMDTFVQTNSDLAHSLGFKCRPIEETITDTAKWLQNIELSSLKYTPMSIEREADLLKKLDSSQT
ncbi:MAG: NAD-dependent epimerase/dehydratase family protein [Bacteriovoracaceae bacterium]|nr:NAD-dependent epimerase/dehydratase family protein [Bacteriovoracaceae bacterium]